MPSMTRRFALVKRDCTWGFNSMIDRYHFGLLFVNVKMVFMVHRTAAPRRVVEAQTLKPTAELLYDRAPPCACTIIHACKKLSYRPCLIPWNYTCSRREVLTTSHPLKDSTLVFASLIVVLLEPL